MDTSKLLLVGISGKKGHGKDTFASGITNALEVLGEKMPELRWHTRHFADPLKDEIATHISRIVREDATLGLFPESGSALEQHVLWEDFDGIMFPGIRQALDDPKEKQHYRLFLQWYGTEFRRRQYADSYWIDQQEKAITKWQGWFRAETHTVVLLPDMRFPNEAEWVRKNNGFLIRVNRDIEDDADPHPSETALDDYPHFNLTYHNEAIEDWERKISRDAAIALGIMVDWKWSGGL